MPALDHRLLSDLGSSDQLEWSQGRQDTYDPYLASHQVRHHQSAEENLSYYHHDDTYGRGHGGLQDGYMPQSEGSYVAGGHRSF